MGPYIRMEQECPLKIYLLWVICKPCGHKIRNVAELHNFIEKAVSAKAEEN